MQKREDDFILSEANFSALSQEFDNLKNPFISLRTLYQQDKYFEEKGTLIKPVEKVVGTSILSRTESASGRIYQQQCFDSYQYVPIVRLLKAHLEQKGIMEAILKQEQLRGSLLETYRDGKYYKENVSRGNERLIPLLLYNDDIEVGNPLGSKKRSQQTQYVLR